MYQFCCFYRYHSYHFLPSVPPPSASQLLDAALANAQQRDFFVEGVLRRFRGFGGVGWICPSTFH